MFRIPAFLAVAIAVAGIFASTAQARGGANFYASPFFRNQGRQAAPSYDDTAERRERADAYARARARKSEAAREAAAARASAARRARIFAQQKQDAAKAAAEKSVTRAPENTGTAEMTSAAKRGDRLPTAAAATAATEETAGARAETGAQPASPTCRKYSAAADRLVDTTCQ